MADSFSPALEASGRDANTTKANRSCQRVTLASKVKDSTFIWQNLRNQSAFFSRPLPTRLKASRNCDSAKAADLLSFLNRPSQPH